MNILLIEDEAKMRNMIRIYLAARGMNVTETTNGTEGIRALADLTELAREEETQFKLEPEPIDLAMVIDKVITTLRPSEQKRIELSCEGPSALPSLRSGGLRIYHGRYGVRESCSFPGSPGMIDCWAA